MTSTFTTTIAIKDGTGKIAYNNAIAEAKKFFGVSDSKFDADVTVYAEMVGLSQEFTFILYNA